MKGYILLFCAFAHMISFYGVVSKDETSDLDIVQNSTLIPKDMFEMIPVMSDLEADSDDAESDDSMDQSGAASMDYKKVDSDMGKKSVNQETPNTLFNFGFDSRQWNSVTNKGSNSITTDPMDATKTYHQNKDSSVKNKEAKPHQKSTTTTSLPLFMAPQYNAQTDKIKKHKHHTNDIEMDSTCKQVAVKVPSTCYKDETLEIPYKCHKDVVKTECKMVNIEVPSTCQKTEYADESYPCQKTKNVCQQVRKQCERIEYKEEEYVCTPSTCKNVKKQIPSKCTRKIKVKVPVECPPPKKCKKIKMIDQSYPCGTRAVCTDEIVTAVCHRNALVDEEYECLKKSEKPSLFHHLGKDKKQDGTLDVTGNNTDIIRKENCSNVTIQVPSECTKSVVEKKPYACTKTEEKQVCKNVTVRVPGVCTKSTPVDELYDCEETNMDAVNADNIHGRVCQDDSESISPEDDTDGSAPSGTDNISRKPRQLKHSKKSKCKKACKVRKVMKEEPYKCEKTQVVKECNTVPTQVPSTCFEENTVEKKYACKIPKTVEHCEKLYTRCTRKKTIVEPYTCEKKEKKCENVPQTCFKKVPVEYEEECLTNKHYGSGSSADEHAADDVARHNSADGIAAKHSTDERHKKISHAKKAVPQICTETVEQDEEYECKKTIQVEECSKEKLCKRKVAVPTLEECTQEMCKDVHFESTCSRKVPVVKDYDCMKKDKVQQCEDKPHKALSTCMKTITKPKAYLCTETQYQTICTGPKKK